MSRKYFFRSGYEIDELVERISINDIRNSDLEPVENLIGTTSITQDDINGTEGKIYNALNSKLTETQRYNFYKSILDECGNKGDIFNLQLIFGDSIDSESLKNDLEDKKRDKDPSELIYSKIRNSLIEFKYRGDDIFDLRFVAPHEPERYEESDAEELSEVIDDIYIEARIYCEEGVIAHSNRTVSDDQKEKLLDFLNTLCDNSLSTYSSISPNEMLALQNAMGGNNEGIAYGGFGGGQNIKKASYRGGKKLQPGASQIVEPAAESGKISKLLFYYDYENGKANRDVLIRVYNDGHLTSSNIHTQPKLIDTLVQEISRIKEYTDFFTTANQTTEKYKFDIINDNLVGDLNVYRNELNRSLRAVLDIHLQKDNIQPVEKQMFYDLIFNMARELLCKELAEFETPEDDFESATKQNMLQEKLEDYRIHITDCQQPDYDIFWNHMYDIISREFNRPVDIIQYAKEHYDL